jgi:glutamine synthetase type III
VLSARELESRFDIYVEQYSKTITMEARPTYEIAQTMIFPAAIRYQNELASTCANLKLVGYDFDTNTLDRITRLVKSLQDSCAALDELRSHRHPDDKLKAAKHVRGGRTGHRPLRASRRLRAARYCCPRKRPTYAAFATTFPSIAASSSSRPAVAGRSSVAFSAYSSKT